MSKYIQLIKNIGLFGIISFASKFISFFLLPLYTAYLSKEEYATVDLAIVVQSLVWPIFSFAISDALLRFGLEDGCNHKKIYTISHILILPGIFIAFCLFMTVNFNDLLFPYRGYFFFYYLTVSINSLQSYFARVVNKVSLIMKISLFSTVLIAVTNIMFLTVFKMGAKGYFVSLISGNTVSIILFFVLGGYFNYVGSLHKGDRKLLKEMLRYAIPMIPNSVFWWINSSLDKFCITALIDLGTVGLYSAAGKVSSILNIVTTVFSQAWSISTVKEYKSEGANEFFYNIYLIYRNVCLFIAIIVICFNDLISGLLFSLEFEEAKCFVPLLVVAFYYSALNIFYGSIFTAYKKTRIIFWTTGAGSLVNLIMNFVLIYFFGAIGAAIATVMSNIMVFICRRIYVYKIIKVSLTNFIDYFERILLVFSALLVSFTSYQYIIYILCFLILICQSISIIIIYKNKKGKRTNE